MQFGTVAAPSTSLGFLGLASAGAAGFFADSVTNMPSISAYTATLDRVSADGSSSSVVGTIGNFSSFNSGNLAFGPDGNLYFDAQALPVDYSGAVATLYSVNTNTGVATAIGSGLGSGDPLALVSNGTTLYGIDTFEAGSPQIYTINTTTGVGTLIGSVSGLPSGYMLDTMAYVPEPAPITPARTIVESGAVVNFDGTVTGIGSTLQVDGTLTSSSAVTVPTGTTLDGIGTVGATVNVQAGGHLAPGDIGPGILKTANTTMTTGANFDVILNGATAGTQYDQLNSAGTVSLGGANLNLSGSFTPVPGNVFTIVSAASVTGTFNGLAQNATIPFNGVSLKVSYAPTTVTLTDPSTAPTIMSPTVTNVTSTTATLGGDVTGSGGGAITKRGVLYALTSANANPILGGSGVTEVDDASATAGTFSEYVTGLTPNTGYSFVAFATNSAGTTYTTPVSTFTTAAPPIPPLFLGEHRMTVKVKKKKVTEFVLNSAPRSVPPMPCTR